jgi:molybdate transport system substrate-binding protein
MRLLAVTLGLPLVLAACGASTASGSAAPTAPPKLSGSVTVFAAASLTEALTDDKHRLEAVNPGLSVVYSFAGSQQLVAQIQSGAPADVVATADETNMRKLVAAKLVEPPRDFARNLLEIVVAAGNPKGVKGLQDLARSDLRVVLADPAVPAGRYGRQALDRQGVKVNPVSLELNVKSELQKVETGEADAGVVYVTDVKAAGGKAAGVAIPADQNVLATYPVAVVRGTTNRTLAEAYVDQLVSGQGRAALEAWGFLSP